MPEQPVRYRFRGNVKPTAEVKRPARVYRNETSDGAKGSKSTSATIDIFDVIDSWGGYWGVSAGEIDAALAKVGKVDTLYVRVNSPGGEATEGVAIANLLRAHAAQIRVTVYGLAASAASYISTAGDVVSMAPGSMMMIHTAWNVIAGNAEEMRTEAGVLDKLDESIASLYALKAGGTTEHWHALMREETWLTADDAVESKLADKVGIEAAPLPSNVDPAEPLDPGDEGDTPFDRAARMFDLSVFAHAPAAKALSRPADSPAQPPEGAVAMTDEELKALRDALGLPDDADATAITAKATELVDQATNPDGGTPPEITDEAVAEANNLTAEQVRDALAAAKSGKVAVSQTLLDELKANAAAGATARAKQLEEERDAAIEAAFKAGKVSADRRDAWRDAWDKDAEGAKSDLASLDVRFPVAKTEGYAGHDGTAGEGAVFSDTEAGELAQLAGLSKEALTNG